MMTENPTEFSLEERLQEIRGIVEKMQMSNLDFDANVKLFSRGTQLIKDCRKYLDDSELQIKKLIETGEGMEEEEFE
jgi:exodeoxyribonuclease VII small subunit